MLKLELQYFGHLLWRTDTLEKTLMLGKIEGRWWRGWQRMRWQHWPNRHEFEQASGVGDGQGSLACCSPWGHKESDTTDWQNWTEGSPRLAWVSGRCFGWHHQAKRSDSTQIKTFINHISLMASDSIYKALLAILTLFWFLSCNNTGHNDHCVLSWRPTTTSANILIHLI